MDDEVAEIEEHPAAGGRALFVAKRVAFRLEFAFEVFREGVELKRRLGGRDDEEVGEAGRAGDVEQRDIEGVSVGEDIDGALGKGFWFQEWCSGMW